MKNKNVLSTVNLFILLITVSLFVLTGCNLTVGGAGNNSTPETATYCKVSFNSDGGTPISEKDVLLGEKIVMPGEPTKSGFIFAGWYNEENLWVFSENKVTEDLTLKARWINPSVDITVSYNSNGGTVVNSALIGASGKITAPAEPTKTGHSFLGWYLGTKKWDFNTDLTNKSITLEAKWALKSYSVEYDLADGGAANSPLNPDTYTIESEPITLSEPTRPGYVFIGWTYEGVSTPTKNVTIAGGSIGELAFVANWEIAPEFPTYSITYNLGGGVNSSENPDSYVQNGESFTLQSPSREHYEFLGWTYEGISTPTLSVSVNPAAEDGDKVFTANWKPTQYTVRYIVNGGEHIGNPTTFTVEDLPISLNNASKYELHFTGWYSDSEFINSITSITTPGDKTLYAKYIDDTDGLFYELNESADGYVVTGYDGISKQVYIAYKQNGLPVVAIADGVFKNSAISEIIIPEGIVSIGAGAFSGCTSLLRISIPSTLCHIGGGAFNGCDPRLSYTVSDGVYYLGNESAPYTVVVGAVAGSVNEITVKDGAKIINTRAFENVSATVKKITLPEGITQLCDDAFAGLTNLTELNIPDSLEYVGTRAFHSCTKLNYTVESGIKYLGNEDNPYLVIVSVEKGSEGLTVKASTKLVCSYAFSAITSSVTFEAGSNSGIFIHPTGNDILFK